MTINYLIGDATKPKHNNKNIIIPHVCNDKGGWGAGFVVALSKRWPEPEERYRREFRSGKNKYLGNVHFVHVEDSNYPVNIYVANMIAQEGTISRENKKPLKYRALANCMDEVKYSALKINAEIHAPRFGSALAGGNWSFIEELIQEIWIENNINVYVYDLPANKINIKWQTTND